MVRKIKTFENTGRSRKNKAITEKINFRTKPIKVTPQISDAVTTYCNEHEYDYDWTEKDMIEATLAVVSKLTGQKSFDNSDIFSIDMDVSFFGYCYNVAYEDLCFNVFDDKSYINLELEAIINFRIQQDGITNILSIDEITNYIDIPRFVSELKSKYNKLKSLPYIEEIEESFNYNYISKYECVTIFIETISEDMFNKICSDNADIVKVILDNCIKNPINRFLLSPDNVIYSLTIDGNKYFVIQQN